MKITDEAKKLISGELADKNADVIRLHTSHSCCGTSLHFEFLTVSNQDTPENINGLAVLMDKETQAWTDTVTIGAQGGQLTLSDSAASCCG